MLPVGVAIFAIADKQVAARALQQHVGKILARAHGLGAIADMRGAKHAACHPQRELRFGCAVHQHGIATLVIDAAGQAEALRMPFRYRADTLLQQSAHAWRQRAHTQFQFGRFRDDVIGLPGLQAAHRDHSRGQGVHVARHDALQRHHRGRRGNGRVGRQVRQRTVATAAAERQQDAIGGGHEGPLAKVEVARGRSRQVVHGEYGVAGKAFEQAFVNHALRAAAAAQLLGRLENHVQGTVPIRARVAQAGQRLGSAEQHDGMPVVAATMHLAGYLAGPRKASRFLDRQCVHLARRPRRREPGPKTSVPTRPVPARPVVTS